jgi:hypothetical protein
MNGGSVVTDQPSGGGGPITESGQIVVLPVSFANIDENTTSFGDAANFGFIHFPAGAGFNIHADVKPAIAGPFTITGATAVMTGSNLSSYMAELEIIQVLLSTTGANPTLTDKAHLPYGSVSGSIMTAPVVDPTPIPEGCGLFVKLYVLCSADAYFNGVILNYTRVTS